MRPANASSAPLPAAPSSAATSAAAAAPSSAADTPAPSRTAFLQIRNVVKDFGGVRAVADVSLDIEKGEIFALLGSSGCGKTTLLRLLAGFETPTSGRIVLDGRDLAGMAPHASPMNMMFQSYALFPHMTVWDNVAFGPRRSSMRAAEVAERVDAMLKLVQLSALAKRKPHQLSGGQQQRVALARSLARKPQLLLLDEPLGALDKKLREETQIELAGIIHEVGVTCVMVTHDQQEAMTMASRLAVMSEGRLLQVGTPSEIYETPVNRFVADFIGDVNLMEGTLIASSADRAVVRCADCLHEIERSVAGAVGMPVFVALRPEQIGISRDAPEASGIPSEAAAGTASGTLTNCVQGRVKDIGYFGSFTVYRLLLPSGLVLKINTGNRERHAIGALSVGDVAWARWSAASQVVLSA